MFDTSRRKSVLTFYVEKQRRAKRASNERKKEAKEEKEEKEENGVESRACERNIRNGYSKWTF
jgi:hypothetical protein